MAAWGRRETDVKSGYHENFIEVAGYLIQGLIDHCFNCTIFNSALFFHEITAMTDSSKTQLGYFIDYKLWKDALDLLNFQIESKQRNRHFNTLSMFYYEKLYLTCLNSDETKENYFETKISSGLFYGLRKEFSVISYVIPKPGLGLRDYKFFTYPMRVVYYAVGLYLLKLSQEFINETYKKIKTIEAFYGGNIYYKSDNLQFNRENIYYRKFYEKFQKKVKEETKSENPNKIVIQIDIENYFNELSVSRLLSILGHFIKPTIQKDLSYDDHTRQQIIDLFQFIACEKKSGIPQADNDIISSFIGYLYLIFGDFLIDDILKKYEDKIDYYKIIRYVDDIYIFITFKGHFDPYRQGQLIYLISSQIADGLYNKLGLKLNSKTNLCRLSQEEEKEEVIKRMRKLSSKYEYDGYIQIDIDTKEEDVGIQNDFDRPQEKLKKIFEELEKIKKIRVEEYFLKSHDLMREEILKSIFDKRVQQIIDKPENKERIKQIFNNFNFDLVKIKPLEILIVLLKDRDASAAFRNFCLGKNLVTTGDSELILKFLCQTNFQDKKLLEKLKYNLNMSEIIDIFIDASLNCDRPGYYNLSCLKIHRLSEMPDVLEQTRLRILSERSESWSIALNHLVNEIQAICLRLDQSNTDKQKYDVNCVVKFLREQGIQHELYIKIKNLFDRRNANRVSHPGSDSSFAWEVTKEEYLDYYEQVGKCLDVIL